MSSDDDIPYIARNRLKWSTDDLLGEGSFGVVYRGYYDGTPAAIKVVRRSSQNENPTEEERAQEIAAVRQHRREIHRFKVIQNPFIIQYLAVFRDQDPHDIYIVTEYLEGGSLYDSLHRMRGRRAVLHDRSFLQVALHIAYGLNHVHSENYTHGDMKPQNILLTSAFQFHEYPNGIMATFAESAKVKIADFGLSRRLDDSANADLRASMTATSTFGPGPCGTFLYMSPEAYQGVVNLSDDEVKASDVYSYALVLFELLSGLQSWQLERVINPVQLYSLVSEGKRPSWGPQRDDINPRYIELVESCWRQSSAERPTVGHILETLCHLEQEYEQSMYPELQDSDLNSQSPNSSHSLRPDVPVVPAVPLLGSPPFAERPEHKTPPPVNTQQRHTTPPPVSTKQRPSTPFPPQPHVPPHPPSEPPSQPQSQPQQPVNASQRVVTPPTPNVQDKSAPIPTNNSDQPLQPPPLQIPTLEVPPLPNRSHQVANGARSSPRSADELFNQRMGRPEHSMYRDDSGWGPDRPVMQEDEDSAITHIASAQILTQKEEESRIGSAGVPEEALRHDSPTDFSEEAEFATPGRVRRRARPSPISKPACARPGNGICISPQRDTRDLDIQGCIPVRSVEARHAGNEASHVENGNDRAETSQDFSTEPDDLEGSSLGGVRLRKVDSQPIGKLPEHRLAIPEDGEITLGMVPLEKDPDGYERSRSELLNSFFFAAGGGGGGGGGSGGGGGDGGGWGVGNGHITQAMPPAPEEVFEKRDGAGGRKPVSNGEVPAAAPFAQVGLDIAVVRGKPAGQHVNAGNVPNMSLDIHAKMAEPAGTQGNPAHSGAAGVAELADMLAKANVGLDLAVISQPPAEAMGLDMAMGSQRPAKEPLPGGGVENQNGRKSRTVSPVQNPVMEDVSSRRQGHYYQTGGIDAHDEIDLLATNNNKHNAAGRQQALEAFAAPPVPAIAPSTGPNPHDRPDLQSPWVAAGMGVGPHHASVQAVVSRPMGPAIHFAPGPAVSGGGGIWVSPVTSPEYIVSMALRGGQGNPEPVLYDTWQRGHRRVVASGLANSKLDGESMLKVCCNFLQDNNGMPGGVGNPPDAAVVAKDLCTAIGNIGRDSDHAAKLGIGKEVIETALRVCVSTMHRFQQQVAVYTGCNYAMCNMFKLDNDINDAGLRSNIANWVVHSLSWNISPDSSGMQARSPHSALLGYTATSAARNFMWRNEANVSALVSVRNGQAGLSSTALLIQHLRHFEYLRYALVVESTASALAMILHFPNHRLLFAQHQGVETVGSLLQAHSGNVKLVSVAFSMMCVLFSGGSACGLEEAKRISKAFSDGSCAIGVVRAIDMIRQHRSGHVGGYGVVGGVGGGVDDSAGVERLVLRILYHGFSAVLGGIRFSEAVMGSFAATNVASLVVQCLKDLSLVIRIARDRSRGGMGMGMGLNCADEWDLLTAVLCDIVKEFCRDSRMLCYLREECVERLLTDLSDSSSAASECVVACCRSALSVLSF